MRRAGVLFAYEAEDIKPGWVALVLVLALAVATYLLWRNMNKQLRRINVPTQQQVRDAEAAGRHHDKTADPPDGATTGETDGVTGEDKPPGS